MAYTTQSGHIPVRITCCMLKNCVEKMEKRACSHMSGWIHIWIGSVLAWGKRIPAIYHKGNKYLNIGTLFSKIKDIWYMYFNVSCYENINIKYKHFEVVFETKIYLVHSFRHSLNITTHFCRMYFIPYFPHCYWVSKVTNRTRNDFLLYSICKLSPILLVLW